MPGPKLSVFLGAVPAENIADMQMSTLGQYPLIMVERFSVPFLPFEAAGMHLFVDKITRSSDSQATGCS